MCSRDPQALGLPWKPLDVPREALKSSCVFMERKSYNDLFASQRCDGEYATSRLDSQLQRLKGTSDYVGRFLIVEV